jgi:two-component system, chemotaxis family, sensor kinase CheA
MVKKNVISPEKLDNILDIQKKQKQKAGVSPKKAETIRIPANKIDHLIQMIGELAIQQSIISYGNKNSGINTTVCQKAINISEKICKEIQNYSLGLRMLPIKSVFQKMERTIKDLSKTQGKLIKIEVDGSDVELDKIIIEKISDPLTHIVRNAVDHGIEALEDRTDSIKNNEATVTLRARQDSSGVIISVTDDGKGLNTERIREKAIEKGVISASDNLSEKEIHQLITAPGFSTAEVVSDISGRGVGMDVVKRMIQEVNGTFDIDSKEGEGSKFTIVLPTSLSIIETLVIKIGEQRYIVPLQDLAEVVDLNQFQIQNKQSGGAMFDLRGKVVPIEKLTDYFPNPESEMSTVGDEREYRPAIILSHGVSLMAFEVDEIIGQQNIVIRPLNEMLSTLPGYSGGSVLSDGGPGLIVDIKKLGENYMKKFSTGSESANV